MDKMDIFNVLDDTDWRKFEFMNAGSVEEAVKIAWRNLSERYYCHYTTLPNLLATICSGKWFLRCSTSVKLNDLVESSKFGKVDIANRTYQLSFGKGVRESAALWGLYGKGNPYAIKVLLPRDEIESWVANLKKTYTYASFKDVVYASIPLMRPKGTGKQKDRGFNLFWGDVTCKFSQHPEIKKELAKTLSEEEYTGWFKDVEWIHEQETRLCIRVEKKGPDGILVPYPKTLLTRLSFTFSPWADEASKVDTRNAIRNAIKGVTGQCVGADKFKRSTVEGALNFMDETVVRCTPARCQFGQMLECDFHRK